MLRGLTIISIGIRKINIAFFAGGNGESRSILSFQLKLVIITIRAGWHTLCLKKNFSMMIAPIPFDNGSRGGKIDGKLSFIVKRFFFKE